MANDSTDNSVHIGRDAYGPVTGGSHNRVEIHQAAATGGAAVTRQVLSVLDELPRLIEQHARHLPEHRLAVRDVRRLRDEVEAAEPDRRAGRESLDRLVDRTTAVTAVAGAVMQLKELIGALWPG